jgi:hypothetical protein
MINKGSQDKILAIIRQKSGITPKEIIANHNTTRAMVFRHLKILAKNNQIFKIGTTPKVKYYPKLNMDNNTKIEQTFFGWAMTGETQLTTADWICPTRDVFQARQEKLLIILKNIVSENLLYLMVGMVGEIGNNSFDHNLGNWRDTAGVLYCADIDAREIILADRGQGILSTIRRVRPETPNDESALNTAFTEIISGRAPEQRGNGLKFVKKIIEENNLSLQFFSGNAKVEIINGKFTVTKNDKIIPGSLAIIKF